MAGSTTENPGQAHPAPDFRLAAYCCRAENTNAKSFWGCVAPLRAGRGGATVAWRPAGLDALAAHHFGWAWRQKSGKHWRCIPVPRPCGPACTARDHQTRRPPKT